MHPAVDSVQKTKLVEAWRTAERKLQRCCDQLDQLNDQLLQEKTRYTRAKRLQRVGSQQLVYLRIQSLEGVRKLFYTYASKKAEEIAELWAQIQEYGAEEQEQEQEEVIDILYMGAAE